MEQLARLRSVTVLVTTSHLVSVQHPGWEGPDPVLNQATK